ncbi:hypothetical protein Ssi03_61830 [Sphaerisporangium siamense]|nr:hypothetical protein Ssi03_61830 [Sphaerisporangium siamense]
MSVSPRWAARVVLWEPGLAVSFPLEKGVRIAPGHRGSAAITSYRAARCGTTAGRRPRGAECEPDIARPPFTGV